MDNPADALLALSNVATATADSNDQRDEEDDRSSSLSELDDAPDDQDVEDQDEEADEEDADEDEGDDEEDDDVEDQEDAESLLPPQPSQPVDGDSEAETERMEATPQKPSKTFQISPSKLVQTMTASDDVRPEIEELTNSEVSSPMTPVADSPIEDLSDAEDVDDAANPLNLLSQAATVSNKRKRLSDVMDITSDERPRKRRTQSLSDVEDVSSEFEEDPEKPKPATRESTVEPDEAEEPEVPEDEKEEVEEAGPEQVEEASDDSKSKKPERRSRRGKDIPEEQEDDDNDAEQSDEDVEADDVDVTAKSEEEQAKKAAAMEALAALEQHFATLRDKLYDEKISQLNHELAQLSSAEPDHPELLKQFDCVNKYRDEKQETEQQLLVFKVGALKRKSVAERTQIHSAYFQTIRDVRERHMESMSEHFYKIQRERFKSSQVNPTYTIPFPQTKVTQVTHQTSYNKEVSILSGVAKYVGFPAAPELRPTQSSDLDTDLQKMGISSSRIRANAASHRHTSNLGQGIYPGPTSASAALSAATASSEQQFIESTPWANPNHPMNRVNRQSANRSPFAADHQFTSTPVAAKTTQQIPGSSSTIVENPSAQPTPGTDLQSSALKQEPGLSHQAQNQYHHHTNGQNTATTDSQAQTPSISPTETRRTITNMLQASTTSAPQPSDSLYASGRDTNTTGMNSSPLQARANLLSTLNRTASAAGIRNRDADGTGNGTRSPFRQDLVASTAGSGSGGGGGMGRFGFR